MKLRGFENHHIYLRSVQTKYICTCHYYRKTTEQLLHKSFYILPGSISSISCNYSSKSAGLAEHLNQSCAHTKDPTSLGAKEKRNQSSTLLFSKSGLWMLISGLLICHEPYKKVYGNWRVLFPPFQHVKVLECLPQRPPLNIYPVKIL